MQNLRIGSFYDLLGVPPDATPSEIRQAFLGHAQRYHPDLNRENPQAEWRFKQIRRVYEVLSDPLQRAAYDDYPARFCLDDVGVDWNNPATIVTEPGQSSRARPNDDPGVRSTRPERPTLGVPWQHNLRTSGANYALLIGSLSALLALAIVVWQIPSPRKVSSASSTAANASRANTHSARSFRPSAKPEVSRSRPIQPKRQDEPHAESPPAPAKPARNDLGSSRSLPNRSNGTNTSQPGQFPTDVDSGPYFSEAAQAAWSVPETPWVAPSTSTSTGVSALPDLLPQNLNAIPLPPSTPVPIGPVWDSALQVRNWKGVPPIEESPWSAPLSVPPTIPYIPPPELEWELTKGVNATPPSLTPATNPQLLDAVSRENLLFKFREAFNSNRRPIQPTGGGLLVDPFRPPTPIESPLALPQSSAIPAWPFGMSPVAPAAAHSTVWQLPSRPAMPNMPVIRTLQPSFQPAQPTAVSPNWP